MTKCNPERFRLLLEEEAFEDKNVLSYSSDLLEELFIFHAGQYSVKCRYRYYATFFVAVFLMQIVVLSGLYFHPSTCNFVSD